MAIDFVRALQILNDEVQTKWMLSTCETFGLAPSHYLSGGGADYLIDRAFLIAKAAQSKDKTPTGEQQVVNATNMGDLQKFFK